MDNDFIKDYENLIWDIAKRFYGVEKEDLFQAGALGLIKAKRNYKTDSNAKFSTYARNYIFGEMYQLVSNKNLKYNKDMLRLYSLIEKTRYKLAQQINKIPTDDEVAIYLDIPVSDIEYAKMIGKEIMSLDEDSEERSFYETIPANMPSLDDKIMIEEGLSVLSEDEMQIIHSRYFEDLTQQEVARKLQMTQVMVSRYEKRGKEKIKDFLTM